MELTHQTKMAATCGDENLAIMDRSIGLKEFQSACIVGDIETAEKLVETHGITVADLGAPDLRSAFDREDDCAQALRNGIDIRSAHAHNIHAVLQIVCSSSNIRTLTWLFNTFTIPSSVRCECYAWAADQTTTVELLQLLYDNRTAIDVTRLGDALMVAANAACLANTMDDSCLLCLKWFVETFRLNKHTAELTIRDHYATLAIY